MAEENINLKDEGTEKKPSGLSPVPASSKAHVPTPFEVAEAFAAMGHHPPHIENTSNVVTKASSPQQPPEEIKESILSEVIPLQPKAPTSPPVVVPAVKELEKPTEPIEVPKDLLTPILPSNPPSVVSSKASAIGPLLPEEPKTETIVTKKATDPLLMSQAKEALLPPKPTVRSMAPGEIPVLAPEKLSREELLQEISTPQNTASMPDASIEDLEKELGTVNAPLHTPVISAAVPTPISFKEMQAAAAKNEIEKAIQVDAQKTTETKLTIVEELRTQTKSPLHPLRTLRSDVEDTVKEHKTSIVSVAAAEENRRASRTASLTDDSLQPKKRSGGVLIFFSIIFLLLGVSAIAYVYWPKEVPIKGQPQLQTSSLISVDEILPLSLNTKQKGSRGATMETLVKLRDNARLSIGLIREIYPTVTNASSTEVSRATIRELLATLAPNASDELVRTLNPAYILGVHVYDGNQALLILTTSSYEQAYAGMLAWEVRMQSDLLPLFDRRPRLRLQNEVLSTTTLPAVINTGFADIVLENHDVRAHKDEKGNIVLLWAFINQKTMVITTNERTLAEVVSRLRTAPTSGQ